MEFIFPSSLLYVWDSLWHDFKKRIPGDYVITGLRRKENVLLPEGDAFLTEGYKVIFIVGIEKTRHVFAEFKDFQEKSPFKKIVIVGGNNKSRYLLNSFTAQERRKVIPIDLRVSTAISLQVSSRRSLFSMEALLMKAS